ncbi:hypothetical protein JHK85_012577 [Glycine max]|nr:hypothetical protein JHK85_012577 [Glycine max]KAG5057245.1 hypothetical protein JHK86_012241 [Glycine max]
MEQNPTFYILNSPYTFHLFTFLNLPPPPATFNCSYPITVSDEYNLFFANCIPESFVSMEIHTEFFNLNRDTSYNYLSSITPTFLPSLLLSPDSPLDGLLLRATMAKHYVKLTGTFHGWDIIFLLFHFISVILLLTITILVGTRWTFFNVRGHE